jgi:hypothetical protein
MSIETFMAKSKLSKNTVKTALDWIIEAGYLEKSANRTSSGRSQSSSFRITKKLFDEYLSICEGKKQKKLKKTKQKKGVKAICDDSDRGSTTDPSVTMTKGSTTDPSRGSTTDPSRGQPLTPHLLHNNSFMNNPSNVCDYNYDKLQICLDAPNSHTQLKSDPIEKIRFRWKNVHFLADGSKDYVPREDQREVISQWIERFGYEKVDSVTREYRSKQNTRLDWNPDAMVAILAGN